MKKHLVVLTGIYYPNPSPTGSCAHRYIQLLKDEYDVDVVFFQSDDKAVEEKFYEGFKLHSIIGRRMLIEHKTVGLLKSIVHYLGFAEHILLPYGNMGWYRHQALKMLKKINKEKKIDTIFSTCSPFEAHLAAQDFKKEHPEIKHIAYTVDLYSTKNRLRAFYINQKKLKQREISLFRKVDSLLLSDEIFDSRPDLLEGLENCSKLPYLLPKKTDKYTAGLFNQNYINCVYAGSFYKDIRNPEYLLKLFSAIKNTKFKLHLYSAGCEELVKKYTSSNDNIIAHEQVNASNIEKIYNSADILISLGNSLKEFKPSKTFEYIVSGRPIVNIYYNNYVDDIISRYPLSLQISNQLVIEQSVHSFEEFCLYAQGKSVSDDIINTTYARHTSPFIKKILLNALQ